MRTFFMLFVIGVMGCNGDVEGGTASSPSDAQQCVPTDLGGIFYRDVETVDSGHDNNEHGDIGEAYRGCP